MSFEASHDAQRLLPTRAACRRPSLTFSQQYTGVRYNDNDERPRSAFGLRYADAISPLAAATLPSHWQRPRCRSIGSSTLPLGPMGNAWGLLIAVAAAIVES